MPSVYSTNYSTSSVTYTRIRVDYSGTSATAHLLYSRTNTWSGATASGSGAGLTANGVSKTFGYVARYGQMTDSEIASVDFTISTSGGTYSIATYGDAGYFAFSGSVTIPAQATPPTGLSVYNLSSTDVSITGTVSITGWGTGGTSHIKRLYLYTYSETGLVEPFKYHGAGFATLSSTITVSNARTGDLNIGPNTRYVIGAYASNGSASVGPTRMDTAVTKPPKAINQFIANVTETSATINWTAPADGGYHTKTYSYSLDNGATWVQCGTVSSGSATDETYTISNLLPSTQYTVKLMVTTSAGTTECDDFPTFTTLGSLAHPLYGSVNGQTKKIKKLYGSVNGQTKLIKHLYGSVNGVAKKIF